MKKNIILLLIGIAAVLSLLSCSNEDSTAKSQSASVAKPQTPKPAARDASAFAQVSATDVDGNARALSEWVGKKPVVVNFWGTWCPPCRRELPALVQLYDEYRQRGVEIVSLAVERSAGPQQVKSFGQQSGMKWVMLMANDDVQEAFRMGNSVPTTIFYNASGKEVARHVGARTYQDFKPDFEKIAGS